MKKNIIWIIAVVVIIAIGLSIWIMNQNGNLGSVGASAGKYTKLTTGANQVISYGPAILHSIVIGTANDSVAIGDSSSASATNPVFSITATVPANFPVETIFRNGITASVTSSNGETFIWSPL